LRGSARLTHELGPQVCHVPCLGRQIAGGTVSAAEEVPPLDVQLKIVDAAAALQYLAVRQAAWLESSDRQAGDLTDDHVAALVDIGKAIDAQFVDVEEYANFLRGCFEEYGPWVNERVAAAIGSGRFNDAELAAFARTVGVTDGDFASHGVALAKALARNIPGVRAQLRDRIAGLPQNLVPTIDVRSAGCDVLGMSAMAGLTACVLGAGAGCASGAGAMIALAAFC
jgi:hypothetical protein